MFKSISDSLHPRTAISPLLECAEEAEAERQGGEYGVFFFLLLTKIIFTGFFYYYYLFIIFLKYLVFSLFSVPVLWASLREKMPVIYTSSNNLLLDEHDLYIYIYIFFFFCYLIQLTFLVSICSNCI